MDRDYGNGFLAFISILSLPIAVGTFLIVWPSVSQFDASDPMRDGFVQPRNIGSLINQSQESTVTIWCETKKDSWLGTAWAIDLKTKYSKKFPTTLITNHHVIEDCINGKGKILVALPWQERRSAIIVNWDKENDLAVIATKSKYPALPLSENPPAPGYWVMAIGTADSYAGSIAFGNVLNVTNTDLLVTNNLSHGNSGGPLIDNEGYVVGVTTWGSKDEQYNGAKSLDVFCKKILECDYENGKSWWDWG